MWSYLYEAQYEEHRSKAVCPLGQQKLLSHIQGSGEKAECRIQCIVCQQAFGQSKLTLAARQECNRYHTPPDLGRSLCGIQCILQPWPTDTQSIACRVGVVEHRLEEAGPHTPYRYPQN